MFTETWTSSRVGGAGEDEVGDGLGEVPAAGDAVAEEVPPDWCDDAVPAPFVPVVHAPSTSAQPTATMTLLRIRRTREA